MAESPIVDCHSHLADRRLWPEVEALLAESRRRGVVSVLANAARFEDWERLLLLRKKLGCDIALGIHPFYPEEWTAEVQARLLELLSTPGNGIVAIGEIGLDFWNGREAQTRQEEVFIEQLAIAKRFGLPVCLHQRKSWNEFWGLAKELRCFPLQGYCHNFTASKEIAKLLMDNGLHLSFGAPLCHSAADRIREVVRYVPLDRMLTETDCPDMPTPLYRGQATSPWHASFPLQVIAQVKQLPLPEVAEQIKMNYHHLFLPR